MPKSNIEFFAQPKEWSERKKSIILKYVDTASRILSNPMKGKTLYYVDGFAGRGKYGDDEEALATLATTGSPVLVAQLADLAKTKNYDFSLKCINVEVERENFERLEAETEQFGDMVTNLHGEFAFHLSNILNDCAGSPVVAFVDPIGIKGMPMWALHRLLARPYPTDVWIRFDTTSLFRRLGHYYTKSDQWEGQTRVVTECFGIDDPAVIAAAIDRDAPKDVRRARALELYKKQLDAGMPPNRRDSFSKSCVISSLDGQLKYYMILCASNQKALVVASDVIAGETGLYEQKKVAHRERRTNQISFASLSDDFMQAESTLTTSDKLADYIYRAFRQRQISRPDLQAEMCKSDKWFGRFTHAILTEALRILKDQNKAELVEGSPGSRNSEWEIL